LATFGDTTNVDDQDAINHRMAEQRGWTIAPEHTYIDNSVSAWRRDVKRKGWDAMLAAVERGEIDAIVVYHGDRLMRQPYDLETLLRVAEQKGVRLVSPTGERSLDSADDRYILRIEVASACRESDNTSRRVKRHHQRQREKGIVRAGGRGGRAFGFEPDGLTHVPGEVKLLREAADRLLAGESIGGLCRDWTRRGVRTAAGNPFGHRSFKAMVLRSRYAGLMPDGETRAAWSPVFDDDPGKAREVLEAVRAVLSGRTLTFTPTNARKYLLSGIAVCGPCGQPVQHRQSSKRRGFVLLGYGCVNKACGKKVQRQIAFVDEWVIGHVLTFLGDEQAVAALAAPDDAGLAREIAVLETLKAEREAQLRSLADHPNLKPDLLVAALASFDERIIELRGCIGLSARRRLVVTHAGLERDGWDGLPLHTKRALVRALFTVTIRPVSKRGPGFDPAGVAVEPVGG
jgi:DNA invertase Pin-like site-specific DNA recombinase